MGDVAQSLTGKTISALLIMSLLLTLVYSPDAIAQRRQTRVTVEPPPSSYEPLTISNLRIEPKRFRPYWEDVKIGFDLNQEATIHLEIVKAEIETEQVVFTKEGQYKPGTNTIIWRMHDAEKILVSEGRYRCRLKNLSRASSVVLAEESRDLRISAPYGTTLKPRIFSIPRKEQKPGFISKTRYSKGGIAGILFGLTLLGLGAYSLDRALKDGDFHWGDPDNPEDQMGDAELATVLSWLVGVLTLGIGLHETATKKRVEEVYSPENATYNQQIESEYQTKLQKALQSIDRENDRIKESVIVDLQPLITGPLRLTSTIEFSEPSGNRILDAEEEGSLILTISNTGPGKAYDVSVHLSPSDLPNLVYRASNLLGDIDPGKSKQIRIPILAQQNVSSGQRSLLIEIKEVNGFDASPTKLGFETKAFVPPDFIVAEVGINDRSGNGQIEQSEIVETTVRVQNRGGDARNATAVVQIGDNVFLTGDSKREFALGTFQAGKSKDVTFSLYTNNRATSVPVNLVIKEERGLYGKTFQVPLALNTPQKRVTELVVVGEELGIATSDNTIPLSVDVDQIPTGSKTRMPDGIAIIVGIELYKHTFDARYKARDATIFHDYCQKVLGILKENIVFRLNGDATKAEFDYIFEPQSTTKDGWLKKRVRPNVSDIVIYLGGHGFPDLSTGRPYFIPHDVRPEQATNGIALETLYQILVGMNPRSVTMFIESCFSGLSGYQSRPQALAVNINPTVWRMESPVSDPRFAVFTASSGTQASYNQDDLKHGIFTYYVLKALSGAADGDKDGVVTVDEMNTYLSREVPRKALEPPIDKEQRPSLFPPPEVLGERMKRVLVKY